MGWANPIATIIVVASIDGTFVKVDEIFGYYYGWGN